VENLSTLANLVMDYGSTFVSADELTLSMAAVALMLVLLAARRMRRKRRSSKSFGAGHFPGDKRASGVFSKKQRNPLLKPCPNCGERLPLSAILCNSCDYNFLAERPGRGQNLLPPPQAVSH
jgi:hypothetical protein